MNTKNTLLTLLTLFITVFGFSQGILQVSGNGIVINNGETTTSTPNNTAFGEVEIASSVPHTFVLENIAGNGGNKLKNISIASSDTEFALSATSFGDMNSGTTNNLTITFTPSSSGLKTATITITTTNNSTNPNYSFNISGTGTVATPDIDISGDGNTIIDGDSSTSTTNNTYFGIVSFPGNQVNTFVIENTGTGVLSSITASLATGDEFKITSTPASSLNSLGTTDLIITFTPSSATTFTDIVTVISNDPDSESTYTFAISGDGAIIPADIDISGSNTSITNGDNSPSFSDNTDFGDVNTSGSLANTFIIENTGGQPLTSISNVSLTTDSEFQVTTDPSITTLNGGETTSFIITFTPSSATTFTDTVTVTSSDTDESPYTFTISGNGVSTIPSILVENGASWKYYDLGNQPSNDPQGDNWKEIDFDDSSWNSGNAQLGYGDNDEVTEINNSTLTGYFRKTINASAAQVAFSNLELNLTYDDGAIVYLNGTEIRRVNMPGGAVNYGTFSSSVSNENAMDNSTFANSLIFGTNVVAVEIHQASAGSSDISFDLELIKATEPPVSNDLIPADSLWSFYDAGNAPSDNGGFTWKEVGFNDGSWATGNAELGYGDTQTTPISASALAAYFRKTINIADASAINDLVLEAIRDDGMVVYINGTEVWRNNMDGGTVTYSTFANSTVGGADETTWISKTIGSNLVNGDNVVAVEVHQVNATSSDISFNFKMTGFEAVPANIERGPYLQTGTPTSVIIKYRTNTSTETIINYGTSLGSLTSIEQDLSKVVEHEIELNNLTPNTKYYYNISNVLDGELLAESANVYIKTAPPVGTNQFVRAWILGDAGTANNNQKAVRDQYYNYLNTTPTNPGQSDMMLFLGDNAYDNGTDSEYQQALFDIYHDMLPKSVAWSCLGNHDGSIGAASSSTQSGPYYDIFTFPTNAEAGGAASSTEAYYSFDYANIHFIVLDSDDTSDRTNTGAMYTWCEQDIQDTTQDWIVAFFHQPPYTKGSHNSDNDGDSGGRMKDMREIFVPLLESYGVDLVLNGHSHSYERSFFINGHYGYSDSFNINTMTVGHNGSGDGKTDGDGAYLKPYSTQEGAVYITTGSAGKISGGTFDHEAMYYSVSQLGSCVLEVEGNEMHVKFIRETGTVDDYFTIYKDDLIYSNNDWVADVNPTSGLTSNNTTIIDTNYTVDSDLVIDDLKIKPGASLEVNPTRSITTGNIEVEGTMTLNSNSTQYSSLLPTGTVSGDVKYKRHVNAFTGTGGNDLISAPVVGQTFGDFAIANPNIYDNTAGGEPTRKLFGPFNKTTDLYQIYDTDVTADAAATLNGGIGYRAARDASQDIPTGTTFTFTGSVHTGIPNPVTVDILNQGTTYPEWNLIGNPFPSYIKLDAFLAANNDFFDATSAGVYGYNGNSNGWEIWNSAYSLDNPGLLIAPGQGFFVASQTVGATVSFTSEMRSIGSGDDFIANKNTSISHLKLEVTSSSEMYATDFYVTDNASLGLDPGYDASVFGDVAPDFAIYSQLVQDNQGIDMAIQCVANTDLSNNVIIPLGINANQGEQLTVSIVDTTLPENTNVYLEDNVANTITLLNTNDYVFTPDTNLNDVGRFFLRFETEALSTIDYELNELVIYNTNSPKVLHIKGQLTDSATLYLYDVQGRTVITKELKSYTNSQQVELSNIGTGIYIATITSNNASISKKLIIE